MKNLIYYTTILCGTLFIFSCSPCPDCPEGPDISEDAITLTTEDTISLQKFQTWVNDWATHGQAYTANTLTTSFTMPLVDITEFTENMGTSGRDSVVAARFYLGMDITDTMPHIMLVGVNSLGDSLTNENAGQYIYDVTKPCPKMCGISSLPDKK